MRTLRCSVPDRAPTGRREHLHKEPSNRRRPTPDTLGHNAILQGLEERVASTILERGDVVTLAYRQHIYDAEQTIREVYFPLDCVLSFVTRMKDGRQIEVGTIGREGLSAYPLLLGASSLANDCYCQVGGDAIRVDAEVFRGLFSANAGFRAVLNRYLQAYVDVLGQLAACNRLHTVYQRCARWLLMTHDRVSGDEIGLTHKALATMLGTGRSDVTLAATALQQSGYIRYCRGSLTILDRRGLETAACECYEIARQQFCALIRLNPKANT